MIIYYSSDVKNYFAGKPKRGLPRSFDLKTIPASIFLLRQTFMLARNLASGIFGHRVIPIHRLFPTLHHLNENGKNSVINNVTIPPPLPTGRQASPFPLRGRGG
jgi:hypothetical protein